MPGGVPCPAFLVTFGIKGSASRKVSSPPLFDYFDLLPMTPPPFDIDRVSGVVLAEHDVQTQPKKIDQE
jgi:hypothetical protein